MSKNVLMIKHWIIYTSVLKTMPKNHFFFHFVRLEIKIPNYMKIIHKKKKLWQTENLLNNLLAIAENRWRVTMHLWRRWDKYYKRQTHKKDEKMNVLYLVLCILADFLLNMMGNFVWLWTNCCGFCDIVIEWIGLG